MPGHVKKGGKQEADPDPSPWLIVSNEMRNNRSIITIIITRPKPAYGRQGLAGSWGKNTDQAGTFWGALSVSLCASGAQLGYKLIWKTN